VQNNGSVPLYSLNETQHAYDAEDYLSSVNDDNADVADCLTNRKFTVQSPGFDHNKVHKMKLLPPAFYLTPT
jgi:hypothetical protein